MRAIILAIAMAVVGSGAYAQETPFSFQPIWVCDVQSKLSCGPNGCQDALNRSEFRYVDRRNGRYGLCWADTNECDLVLDLQDHGPSGAYYRLPFKDGANLMKVDLRAERQGQYVEFRESGLGAFITHGTCRAQQ